MHITETDLGKQGTERRNDERDVTLDTYLNVPRNLLHIFTPLQSFHPKLYFCSPNIDL